MSGGVLRPKRFWKEARAEERPEGFALLLDGREARTPDKNLLLAPNRALGEAMAAEWGAQGETLDFETLPVTRAVNLAIDRLPATREAVIDDAAAYGGSDALAHRTEEGELADLERAAWDPLLAWAAEALGAPLEPVGGIMPKDQAPESLAALRAAVAAVSDLQLIALHELTTLSGSLVLALAVARGRLTPEEGWRLAMLGEEWQAARWGRDEEAEARMARRRDAFLRAARLWTLASGA
ncbi:ATP12 family chaperone protein [Neomegalonema sp.]|uniref:ATP12 family chaperone protein n=1 Tax=Neomegalonema sp. TaxID=2039713 RepID=UPI002608E26F|nr:ATP12 family protein [Neomegalonema sp.]MDD2868093.1 ATPase [Neomegalonema sp.]